MPKNKKHNKRNKKKLFDIKHNSVKNIDYSKYFNDEVNEKNKIKNLENIIYKNELKEAIKQSEKEFYERKIFEDQVSESIEKSKFNENELLVAKLNSDLSLKYEKKRINKFKELNEEKLNELQQCLPMLEEMEKDRRNFGNYDEIKKAGLKNYMDIQICKNKIDQYQNGEFDDGYLKVLKTEKNVNIHIDSEYEYEYEED